MHGRLCEQRERRLHMWPNPVPTTLTVDSAPASLDCFSKDGRKISTGDCALFKPPRDSPPFIGIIRFLTETKEEDLKLGVSWLYRPADLKLGKGTLVEAAPNEIFYSFHEDEIPAASLLHPCKVTFLRKGVELPSGVSSYVCRRVYDIENKCLWWLTDRDYINERQQEVDNLLDKPKQEMHGVTQFGGRSPKPLNGSPKHGVHSQVQGKKRERFCKTDDGNSGHFRAERVLKSEIAKITEKGGLINLEGVEKLVQLMQPCSSVKRIDLGSRIIIADVIAVTEKVDCLRRFLQLRGLCVLDEWLQEVHKGKISDCSNPNEGENSNSLDGFLLALLRALDKLPVNLDALQTCNAGKSVNHLRSHKNFEIQKKARSIVDTWKKRVEADMNMIESCSNHSVSWPSKPVSSEVSQKKPGVQPGSGEAACKFSSATSPGLPKSPVSSNLKDFNPKINTVGGTLDQPWTTMIKDGKSNSSGQSPNNSQSSLSGSSNKISSNTPHHQKSRNAHSNSSTPAVQMETGFGKLSFSNKNMTSEKVFPDGLPDAPPDHMNNQRLIVRLPCPAQSFSAGSFDDPSVSVCRPSSPSHAEKNENLDQRCKRKNNTLGISNLKMESSQGEDRLAGSDGPPPGKTQFGEDCEKSTEPLIKSGDPFISSINTLLESCVKISETTASAIIGGDQVGIDLLASVAAGQVTKSEIVSAGDVKLKEVNDSIVRFEDNKTDMVSCEEKTGEPMSQLNSSGVDLQPWLESGEKLQSINTKDAESQDDQIRVFADTVSELDRKEKDRNPLSEEKSGKGNCEDSIFSSSSEMDFNDKGITPNDSTSGALLNHLPLPSVNILSNSETGCENGDSRVGKASNGAEDLKPDSCHSKRSNPCEQGTDKCIKSIGGNLPGNGDGELKEHSPSINSSAVDSDTAPKLDFDLNEEFPTEDVSQRKTNSPVQENESQSAVYLPSPSPFTMSGGNLCPVTFAAAAKGPFPPPENPLRSKGELGWKGSAATSAFRPAEPRKNSEINLSSTGLSLSKHGRPRLDIDLNVPFLQNCGTLISSIESGMQNNHCDGEFDLDLNRADENPAVANEMRGFDLNGPGSDELGAEIAPISHHLKTNLQFPSHLPIVAPSMNKLVAGNFSPWFVPPAVPGRVDPIYAGSQSGSNYSPDMYGGRPPFGLGLGLGLGLGAPFQYPGFPFETTYPLSSSISFSSGSQFAGPSGSDVSSHYQRPYVVSVPENRKWGSQNADLNAGGLDIEKRHQRVPVASSHAMVDEHSKMFLCTGGVAKRKEPEGGWVEASNRGGSYKQQQKPQASWK